MPLTLQGLNGAIPSDGTTTTTAYTCPASTKAIIKSITLNNTDPQSLSVSVSITRGASTKRIYFGYLWAGERDVIREVHILEAGEALQFSGDGDAAADGDYDVALIEET